MPWGNAVSQYKHPLGIDKTVLIEPSCAIVQEYSRSKQAAHYACKACTTLKSQLKMLFSVLHFLAWQQHWGQSLMQDCHIIMKVFLMNSSRVQNIYQFIFSVSVTLMICLLYAKENEKMCNLTKSTSTGTDEEALTELQELTRYVRATTHAQCDVSVLCMGYLVPCQLLLWTYSYSWQNMT